jgi:hypothetical protein
VKTKNARIGAYRPNIGRWLVYSKMESSRCKGSLACDRRGAGDPVLALRRAPPLLSSHCDGLRQKPAPLEAGLDCLRSSTVFGRAQLHGAVCRVRRSGLWPAGRIPGVRRGLHGVLIVPQKDFFKGNWPTFLGRF